MQAAIADDSFAELSTRGKLDEVLVAAFIVSRSKLTHEDVGRCKSHDPDALMQILQFMLAASMQREIPLERLGKLICSTALVSRGEQVGRRVQDVV